MANRVLAAMRTFFNWLVSQAILETSPCYGIKAREKELSRDRVLTDGELGRVLKAAQILSYPYGVIVQLLLTLVSAAMKWPACNGLSLT